MKKLFNIFLVGGFVLVTFAFLPILADANMLAIEQDAIEEDGGGGGGTIYRTAATTPPPPAPATSLNVTYGLNDSVYEVNEDVVLTASVSRNVCSNVFSDIRLTARIPAVSPSYQSVIHQVVGGGITINGSEDFTGPSTPGNYVMQGKVEVYAPAYYVSCPEGTDSDDFGLGCFSSYTTTGLIDVQDERNADYGTEMTYDVTYFPGGTTVLDSATFEIPFTVVAPLRDVLPIEADIHVKVDGVVYEGTTTVSAGQFVEVYWDSINAVSCTARGLDSDGQTVMNKADLSRADRDAINMNLVKDTVFSLTCSGVSPSPGSTSTSLVPVGKCYLGGDSFREFYVLNGIMYYIGTTARVLPEISCVYYSVR